ncbi:hypothetical protein CWI38_1541p0030 [Hamiltosporidium tvaerminnensis]|uniref:Uncharacterized protein n=1 Tax=Hamiltosporidium tvaerminnensis TaxID=1176355 RepID=A0A4Q9LQZ2_9MICR|nr:hypothetical protein CWI38_1773p0010 [Hamiltosporidium tvaerminnensis]TBU10804.1 hypothetical protein CWI38_1541p0030 [Hamiltosporidium tvaerminnensis]
MNVEAYIQSIVLMKTVEKISFDREEDLKSWERASFNVILEAEMHKQPHLEPTININEESNLEED